jgi:hypothetical protein
MALAKKLVLTPRKRTDLGAPGTLPPRKAGRSSTMKAVNLAQSTTRATGAANGLLTTGEHPERDAYMKRTGKTKDPLEAAGGKVARSFVNQSAGPRKGMTALEILKGGAKYHVYYGPKGTRSVFRVSGRPRRPKGIGVSAPSGYYQP